MAIASIRNTRKNAIPDAIQAACDLRTAADSLIFALRVYCPDACSDPHLESRVAKLEYMLMNFDFALNAPRMDAC